jgi:ceramide glucosyltransferase
LICSSTHFRDVKPSIYQPYNLAVSEEDVPGVSILRPLRGLDCNLYENLESSFLQKYPPNKYEIIFSVAEEGDQAVSVVKSLMERFPQVDASMIIGESRERI